MVVQMVAHKRPKSLKDKAKAMAACRNPPGRQRDPGCCFPQKVVRGPVSCAPGRSDVVNSISCAPGRS